jgi:hypothetical protein
MGPSLESLMVSDYELEMYERSFDAFDQLPEMKDLISSGSTESRDIGTAWLSLRIFCRRGFQMQQFYCSTSCGFGWSRTQSLEICLQRTQSIFLEISHPAVDYIHFRAALKSICSLPRPPRDIFVYN